MILPEKYQLLIVTFEAKTKRFKMLIINVGKKSTKMLAYLKPQLTTFLCNDVEKWWILMLREIAEFWFKTFQNAWIHFWNRFTFKSQSAFLLLAKCLSESDPKKKTVDQLFMPPQNFGTKFKIHKKVLTFCWIALVAVWGKVFFSSRTC